MSKSQSLRSRRLFRSGIATAAVSATVLAASAAPALAAAAALTLSSATGPSAAANPITITASSSTAWLSGISYVEAYFNTATCPNTATSAATSPTSTNVAASSVAKLTTTKAQVTVPTSLAVQGSAASTRYNLCVYGNDTGSGGSLVTTDQLIGTATYTVAVAPDISSGTTVSPSSGPAAGGTLITVTTTGGNLPTTAGSITATLGGTAMTSVTPVSATKFTAITPYHAWAANVPLIVTTAAGSTTKSNAYSYKNSISVSPNTAPNTAPVYLDVLGSNFNALSVLQPNAAFVNSNTDSRVFLVSGAYSNTATGGGSANYTNGPQANCGSVYVVSDSELVCRVDLLDGLLDATGADAGASTPVPNGTYTVTVVVNGAKGAGSNGNPSDLSSGATFTVAPY